MRIILVTLFVTALETSSALAQVTTCIGDVCTVEENGSTRQLSEAEVGKMKRAEARRAIENLPCRWAEVPSTCEGVQKTLYRLFPL